MAVGTDVISPSPSLTPSSASTAAASAAPVSPACDIAIRTFVTSRRDRIVLRAPSRLARRPIFSPHHNQTCAVCGHTCLQTQLRRIFKIRRYTSANCIHSGHSKVEGTETEFRHLSLFSENSYGSLGTNFSAGDVLWQKFQNYMLHNTTLKHKVEALLTCPF